MKDREIALKKIAKGIGIVIIGIFISKVLAYVYRLIIARIGVEQYGLFSIASAVYSILFALSMLGMSEGVIRFVSYYKGKGDERRIKGTITSSLKISMPVSVLLGAFLFFFSDWIAMTFFHSKELNVLFKIFAFIIPLDVARNIFTSAIKAFQKVEYEVYSKSVAENLVKVILTAVAVCLGFGVIGAAIAYLIAIFISCVLSFYFLEKKVFSILKTEIISIKSKKILFMYSFPLLFTGFVYLVIQWTDTLMIGYFKTAFEVGVYNVALPTAFLLFVIPSAARTLFFPVMSEIYAKGRKDVFKSVYRTVTKWIIIVESAIFILLVVFSQQIVRILFGEVYVRDQVLFLGDKFAVSSLALIILAFGMILGEFTITSKDVLMVLKKTKLIFFNIMAAATLNIVLNYFLIPVYGIIGAAIATSVAYTTLDGIIAIQAYFITKINPIKWCSIKTILIGIVVFLFAISFKLYLINSLFYMGISALMILLLYIALLLIFRIFEKEDKVILRSIQTKILKTLT